MAYDEEDATDFRRLESVWMGAVDSMLLGRQPKPVDCIISDADAVLRAFKERLESGAFEPTGE